LTATRNLCRALWAAACLLCLQLGTASTAQAQQPVPQPTSGYGAQGTYAMQVDSFLSTAGNNLYVKVYTPIGATGPVPTVFFSHGLNTEKGAEYPRLIQHIVSRGYAFVFSPYNSNPPPALTSQVTTNYNNIFNGWTKAVQQFSTLLDTTRAAFMGFSFGGGATISLARRGLARGWGATSAFITLYAPWYTFDMTDAQYAAFPSHVKLLILNFRDDNAVDPRIARDIFKSINIPDAEKDHLMLYSTAYDTLSYTTTHEVPHSSTDDDENFYDFYGTYKFFDALADYTWNGNAAAKDVCLGHGSAAQLSLGEWPNATPVRPMQLLTDSIVQTLNPTGYLQPCNLFLNPRRGKCLAYIPAPTAVADATTSLGLSLVPNPAWGATSMLTFAQPLPADLTLRAYDALGRELRTWTVPANSTELALQLDGLPAGLLLLQAESATGRQTLRLLIP